MAAKLNYCPFCGAKIEETFKYCPSCGRDKGGLQRGEETRTQTLKENMRQDRSRNGAETVPEENPFESHVLWEHEYYPTGVDSLVRGLLRVECRSDVSAESVKTESHLVMILDISGSMDNPAKYPLLRQALELMMNNLEDGLYLTVVLFSSTAELLCNALPAAAVRDNAGNLITRMDQTPIRFQQTNLSFALDIAMDAVREFRSRRDDVVPRMYILTDGQLTDPRQCYDRTGELAGLNIEVNSYGFGGDFAFQSMKQLMGQCPGGMVKQIRDTNDILETFRRIVQVTALIAASQVKLELQYTDGVIPGDFFCHRPAPRIWRVHDFQPARAPQFDIGNIELQRRYIWAFEARLPENAHTGLAVGILNIHFRRTGRFHCASWPILPPITADSKVGDKNEDVGRVFTALEDLRDNSPEILIAAYEAKIQIAQEEGRDPDYIRAMQDVLDKLRKGLRRKDIDQALLRAAEVDPASFFPPPPRQMSGPDQG